MTEQERANHERFLRALTAHEPALRAFIRRLVPSKSDADDIVQEVAVVLWEKFDEFRPEGDFKAWAFGIARLKVLSWMRDRGRDRVFLRSDVVELLAEESSMRESLLAQQREALEVCLKKMPSEDRNLLARAYSRGGKIQQVAKTSGRTVNGFYQWLYRMRQLLLDCIQRELATKQ